jgi:hypothetical protein
MSKTVTVVPSTKGKARKKGRKGRKVGTGIEKLSHSKWGSYAGLIAHQQSRRLATMARRYCKICNSQFHSKAAFNRHVKKHLTN